MTETASERLGAIRTALRELVDEHGSELLSSPARMSNLIKDLLPDDQQLARILVIAAEQDVASKLREHGSQGMDAATATRLVATAFAASTMFDRQACLLVVGELAVAMGLASGESTTPVISDSGPTPAVQAPIQDQVQIEEAGPASSARLPRSGLPRSRLPRSRPRRGLYPALVATTVVIGAAAVVLGIKIGSSPPAPHSPASSRAPASGNFAINRQLFSDGTLVLTLTTIKLGGNLMTVYVRYHNASGSLAILGCQGDTDPAASSITLADGKVIHSAATYCSDHPSAAFPLNGGESHSSYAVFHVNTGFPEPFSFYWPTGNGSGTVSDIKL